MRSLAIMFLVTCSLSISKLNAQIYFPGFNEIQLDATRSGLSIQNQRSNSASWLDIWSDNNRNVQLGIGNSSNLNVGPDVAYLFTPAMVPFEFYTGGLFRRMHITADGNVGVNAPSSFIERFYVGGDVKIDFGNLIVTQGTAFFNNSPDVAIIAASIDSNAIEGYATMNKTAGVYGKNDDVIGYGVHGYSHQGTGVFGNSTNGNGIVGNSVNGSAILGGSTNNYGVEGRSEVTYGVYGKSNSISAAGVYGESVVYGTIGHGIGVGDGLLGTSSGGHGVVGRSTDNGNGQFDFYADGTSMDYGSSSSIRWKHNIVPIDRPLEKLNQIRGVYYDWDKDHGGRHDVGFIAEEVGNVLPEIVSYEENGVDAIALDYSKLTALLAEAIKELRSETQAALKERDITIQKLTLELESIKMKQLSP